MSDHFGTLCIKGLKAIITFNSLISGGLDNDRIVYFISFFVEKYSKFIDNIRSGNFINTFCQKYQQIPKKSPPHPLCGAPLHWLYFNQCLTSFFSVDHLLSIYAWFLNLFHFSVTVINMICRLPPNHWYTKSH